MKTYKQFNEEVLNENPIKWFKNILKGAGKALVPAGAALGQGAIRGLVGTAKDLAVPKDEQNPVASASKLKGPREGK